jgi:hypothetical protein
MADPTLKQFDAGLRKLRKMVTDARDGGDPDDMDWEHDLVMSFSKARDRLSSKVGVLSAVTGESTDVYYERIRSVADQLLPAIDEGRVARKSARDREIRRLTQEMHEAQPRPGTYEHELAMMRGRTQKNRSSGSSRRSGGGSGSFDKFFNAYVDTALWSSTDDDGDSLDVYDASDIDQKTLEQMAKDAQAFLGDNDEDIDGEYAKAGHDFWLTRNGHGAGFWDGDWPGASGSSRSSSGPAKRLTEAAHAYGSFDLYLGDDEKIHGS